MYDVFFCILCLKTVNSNKYINIFSKKFTYTWRGLPLNAQKNISSVATRHAVVNMSNRLMRLNRHQQLIEVLGRYKEQRHVTSERGTTPVVTP